jgi:hypothetical protein
LKWGTSKQYLSGPKALAEEKFPGNLIWRNQEWYTKIRCDIEATIAKRCIQLGLPVEDKSEPVGRELLIMLTDIMLNTGTEAEQIKAIEFRAAIVMTFAAVGRGGECGLSSYNLAHWNSVYESLFLDWQESKTNQQKPMNFFPDAEHYQIDFNHAMACYFIVGAGSKYLTSRNTDKKWIFPFLDGTTPGSATTKITEYLRRLQPSTGNRVADDVTATALRVGSVQEIVDRTGDIVLGTIRGGWGGFLASVATIMEYYQQTHQTLSRAGRALAGWRNYDQHVHPPACSAIMATFREPAQLHLFNNFLAALFSAHFDVMRSHLRDFGYCMFAALVQYLPQFIANHGEQHVVVVNLFRVAREFGYKPEDLLLWSKLVSDDWALKNLVKVDPSNELAPVVVRLQEEVLSLKELNTAMINKMAVLESTLVRKVDSMESTIIAAVRAACAPQRETVQSPARKRQRPSGDAEPASTAAQAAPVSAPPPLGLVLPPRTTVVQLKPPSPPRIFLNSTSLLDLYLAWYRKRLTVEQVCVTWDAPTQQDRNRVTSAMKYTTKVLASGSHEAVLNSTAPAAIDPGRGAWEHSYRGACIGLVQDVAAALFALDGKKFTKATINALSNRVPSDKATAGNNKTPKKKGKTQKTKSSVVA